MTPELQKRVEAIIAGRADRLKGEARARAKKWREKNPDAVRAIQKKFYHSNPNARDEARARHKKQREANPEAYRAYYRDRARNRRHEIRWEHIKRAFGLSREQWESIFTLQGNKCAICPATEPGRTNWHTDHCHETNVVRGILCGNCNAGLGLFDDNEDTLIAAAAYVRKHRECAQLP